MTPGFPVPVFRNSRVTAAKRKAVLANAMPILKHLQNGSVCASRALNNSKPATTLRGRFRSVNRIVKERV